MRKTLLIFLAVMVLFNISSCKGKKNQLNVVEKFNRANKLYGEGKIDEAEDLYLLIIDAYGDSPESYLKLGKIYRKKNQFDKEESILIQGIERTEFTNDLRDRLIDLYLNVLDDYDRGTDIILDLLEGNLHSYKFEFIRDQYEEYMYDGKFTTILEVYKNNSHEDRKPIYLMRKAEKEPTEGNLNLAFEALRPISINDASSTMQREMLAFHMKYGTNDEVADLVKKMSDGNKQGSIFGAYNHWLTEYRGEYILKDVLHLDLDGDGREENLLLLTKEASEPGRTDYSLELQNVDTGEIYDKYTGVSDFKTLRLEYPLQDDPNEKMVNLVQTKDGQDFEFIDVFFISNRKISKSF